MVRQASASSKMHWRSADLSTWNMRTWGSLRWSRCQLIDQNWSMRIPFSGLHQGRGMRSATWQQKKQLRSTELKNIEHIFIRFHQYLKNTSNTSNTSNKDDHFWAPEMQKASPITARLAFKRTLAFVGWNTLKHAETMQRCWLLKGKLHSNIFTAVHNLGFFHAATHATQSSELHDCYLRLQKHQEMILLGTCTARASEWTSWLHQWRWKLPPLKRRIQDYRNPQELQ